MSGNKEGSVGVDTAISCVVSIGCARMAAGWQNLHLRLWDKCRAVR